MQTNLLIMHNAHITVTATKNMIKRKRSSSSQNVPREKLYETLRDIRV